MVRLLRAFQPTYLGTRDLAVSTDYETIEQMLAGILADLSGVLSDSERAEIDEFIVVGEYGVALEALGALLVEESKPLALPVFERIVELAEVMKIRESVATDALRDRVSTEEVPPDS